MEVLITGGTGFIGYHLTKRLLKDGHNVTILDNMSTGKNTIDGVELIKGDVLDFELVDKSIEDKDLVIHLAGILGTSEMMEMVIKSANVNIIGTLNILEACKKHNAMMIFSSKPNPLDWVNPYTITKLAGEMYCQMYYDVWGVKTIVLTYFNLYGPNQKSYPVQKYIPTFTEHAFRNEPLPIFGTGEQTVDALFIEDAVEATMRAIKTEGAFGKIIQVGTGVETSVNDVAKLVIKLTNSKSTLKHQPMRAGEPIMTHLKADTTALKEILKFEAKTTLEEGLKKTIPYFEERLKKEGKINK